MTKEEAKDIFEKVVKLVKGRVCRINRFRSEGQKLFCERSPEPAVSMTVLQERDSEGKYGRCCKVSAEDDGVGLAGNNDQIVRIRPSDDLQEVVREFLDSVLPERETGH